MATLSTTTVWVFNVPYKQFSGGIFFSLEKAKQWIAKNRLTGVLTQYPVDISSLDFAIKNEWYTPPASKGLEPSFIGSFTCASMEHYHFEDGEPV